MHENASENVVCQNGRLFVQGWGWFDGHGDVSLSQWTVMSNFVYLSITYLIRLCLLSFVYVWTLSYYAFLNWWIYTGESANISEIINDPIRYGDMQKQSQRQVSKSCYLTTHANLYEACFYWSRWHWTRRLHIAPRWLLHTGSRQSSMPMCNHDILRVQT